MAEVKVVKESGEEEAFDKRKILKSLLSSGVKPEVAKGISDDIAPRIEAGARTRDIFRMASRSLQRCDVSARMRYSLKKAIYALGPSGYPFERYVARIFEAYGYEVEVGKHLKGHCVTHEVDVVARKGRERYIVECKFHHNGKVSSDVKTALYIHSRFQDIVGSHRAPASVVHHGMLVTNTRFSSEAIKYARCVGLKAVGWKYPEGESLERLIDGRKTYPVTVLPSVNSRILQSLLKRDIILAKDLEGMSERKLLSLTGLDARTVSRLKAQAGSVCQ